MWAGGLEGVRGEEVRKAVCRGGGGGGGGGGMKRVE